MYAKWMMSAWLLAGLCCQNVVVGQMMSPSEEHKILKNDVGEWDCEMKIWMAGPDAEPMVTKGSEVNKMFSDFWLISEFKASFGGQPFEGRAILGYDPAKKKYIGTWLDTMNPYMSRMEGDYDASSKTLTMMMNGTGPDGKPTRGKNVTVTKDEGKTRVFTMYNAMPGSEEMVKSMEITYKKK